MCMPRLVRPAVPAVPHHACLCASHLSASAPRQAGADRRHNAGIAGCRRSCVTRTASFVDGSERLLRGTVKPEDRGPEPKTEGACARRQSAACV